MRIFLSRIPDLPHPLIDLQLPELTKKSVGVFHASKVMKDLKPAECKDEIQHFHSVIREEKGHDAIVQAEVKITISSSTIPTMVLLDSPGLAPALAPGKVSKKIFTTNLKRARTKKVNTIVCSTVNCNSVKSYLSCVDEVAGGNALGDSVIIYTHVDKVRAHHAYLSLPLHDTHSTMFY